jgi:hypothetical protein
MADVVNIASANDDKPILPQNDDATKWTIEEYKSLRAELIELAKSRQQLVTYMVGGVGVALSYALGHSDPQQQAIYYSACACAGIFVWAGVFLYESNLRNVWRIATYIACVIESKLPSLKWETAIIELAAMRSKKQGNGDDGHRKNTRSIDNEKTIFYTLWIAASAVAAYRVSISIVEDKNLVLSIISGLFICAAISAVGVCYMTKHTREWTRDGNIHKAYKADWDKMRDSGRI